MDTPDSNPLLSVFSREDLARLEQGLDMLSKPRADRDLSYMLTDEFNRVTQWAIADWFRIAEQKGSGEHFLNRLRKCFRHKHVFLETLGELMAGWWLYDSLDSNVEYRCAGKGADYRIATKVGSANCEVKSAVGGIPAGRYSGPGIPASPKIKSWFKNIAKQLGKDDANIVLLIDFWRPGITPHYVLDALYGSLVVEVPVQLVPGAVDPLPKPRFVRARNGKFTPGSLTRVSAVGVLRFVPMDTEWRIHAWFVHNLHAAKPIPPEALDPHPQLEALVDKSGLRWRKDINFNGLPLKKQ